jgi:rRNA-processing protein FCF1
MEAHRRRDVEGLKPEQPQRAVILDSNFLFIPRRFSVDIFEELETILGKGIRYLVTRASIQELELLKEEAKPSFKKEVEFALLLAEKCDIIDNKVRPEETVDDSILRIAAKEGFLVATNDTELRKKLKKAGISVIFLRQRAYLDIEGPLV